jgi:hypothetical protein
VPAIVDTIVEEVLNTMMIAQCYMIDLVRELNLQHDFTFWQKVAERTGMDLVIITDRDGVIIECNDPFLLGWRTPEEEFQQAQEFRGLLDKSDGVLCQKIQGRSLDGLPYKFVGLSRSDANGFIQVALQAVAMQQYKQKIIDKLTIISPDPNSIG